MIQPVLGEASELLPAAGVHGKPFDGELVLLDLEHGDYYGLNAVGTYIWNRLCERASLGEIASAVAQHFEVDRTQALKDATMLVEELLRRGLVTTAK